MLEIADCDGDRARVRDLLEGRRHSLHKLDTVITALKVFRAGLVEEFTEYDRRERELEELRGE